ncbi:MAG: hypothetical protein PVF73_09855 [Bacteroidales bacterium]|jgi:hypothetical protein
MKILPVKKSVCILIILLAAGSLNYVFGQGCSDAGFCTINSLKTSYDTDPEADILNQIKVGFSNGKADYNIDIWAAHLEYSRLVKDKFSFALKLSSISQSGNSITAAGLSDVFISTTYLGIEGADFTAGFKLPLNNGNKKKDGLPLPMDYQSSLGTIDLIMGVGYTIKKLRFTLAVQQPLTQNKNTFFAEDYSQDSKLNGFQSTNKYVRKGDALFRISYGIGNKEKLIVTPGLLAIYHLADDEYTNAGGMEMAIDGSQGLTLNGNVFVGYSINQSNMLELSFGTPFITRKARPDGLTREYIVTLEYSIKF